MKEQAKFYNSRGRAFCLGDHVIAYNEPITDRAFPCAIHSAPQSTEGRALPQLVAVQLFLPYGRPSLIVHVTPACLFPSFDAIAFRSKFPAWLAGRFFPSHVAAETRQASPFFDDNVTLVNFDDGSHAIEVAEAFAVRHYLGDERYATLDRWLGSVDRFVDANTLQPHERRDVDALRLEIQRQRAVKLRRYEKEGAPS